MSSMRSRVRPPPMSMPGPPAATRSMEAMTDRYGVSSARIRSSTSSRSGPSAGFSLVTRLRTSSVSRTDGGSGSGPRPGNAVPNRSSTRSRSARSGPSSSSRTRARDPRPTIASWRAMSRWPTSWMSPRAAISPAATDAPPGGRSAFIRAASRRIAARSVTTTSPRTPSRVPSIAYRSRAVRRTWKSRIAEGWHALARVVRPGTPPEPGRRLPDRSRGAGSRARTGRTRRSTAGRDRGPAGPRPSRSRGPRAT